MMHFHSSISSPLLLILSLAHAQAQDYVVISQTAGTTPSTETIEYTCTLFNLWTPERHPSEYPSGNAHWSPPVAVGHSAAYTMWESGGTATNGIESLAELGRTSTLEGEINAIGAAVGSPVVGDDLFFDDSDRQTLDAVQLTPDRPFLSIATMVAPSPDWFSGLSSWNAVNTADGMWYDSFSIETYPWDAGTEFGESYSIDGTSESRPITRLTVANVPNDLLKNPAGTAVDPVARWECQTSAADVQDCNFICLILDFIINLFSGRN